MNWSVIKAEIEYQKALERLEEIFESKTDDPEFREAELLTLLVEQYENTNEEPFPDPDSIEMIKYRMEQNNMRNKDLGMILGSVSKASEVLNRKSKLTLTMIRKINKALNIPAELLIEEYDTIK